MRGARVILAAAAAVGAAVPGVYLALGGGSYEQRLTLANPCETREWRNPDGLEEIAEQVVLSALDGAACDLRVPREEMVLALATPESRKAFARRRGLSEERIEQAAGKGLDRAVDDAVAAGAVGPAQAALLRGLVDAVPLDRLVDALGNLG